MIFIKQKISDKEKPFVVKTILLFLCLSIYHLQAQNKQAVDYVNPFVGASTDDAETPGKTFPGATVPFGMTQLSPNTITGGDNGSGYSYEHKTIEGFAMTQMNGVGWYGDLGNFLVMPTMGKLKTIAGIEGKTDGYRCAYDKKTQTASAGYYSVLLTEYNIKAALTASPHGGVMRFTFPSSELSRIQIDLARRVGGTSTQQYIKIVNENTIEGWMKCTPDGGGWGDGDGKADYTLYFYTTFSKPLKNYGVWSANIAGDWKRKREDVLSQRYQDTVAHAAVFKEVKEMQGKHLGFFTEFATRDNEAVELKTAISFVSMDGAKNNYDRELSGKSFDDIHLQARKLWNDALSKMKVEGGSENDKSVFYTALYHAMIDPRTSQDIDGNYLGGDNQVHHDSNYTRRTIFSGWDVFRAQMPLLSLIMPSVNNDLINSLIHLAEETKQKWYSRWELLNAYSECMIGNPAISVIEDAYAKGIRGYDVQKGYQYSLNTAGLFDNNGKGFSPQPNSISNTLEYAYTDWCLSQFARALSKNGDADLYANKSLDYQNVFDKEKHWFRPRESNGDWAAWPKEGRLADGYGTVESNPYQQGWFVPQDIDGMIKLMGGKDSVRKDLVFFFNNTQPDFHWNSFYNHANEPVHHVAFLFNYLDAPWLTQKWTRTICKNAYANNAEGLVGNDDCGQMSAWYVLAACGLYQVCPGNLRFDITSPVFNKISIQTDKQYAKGKIFTIIAKGNSSENIYIQKAFLNGRPYNKCYLNYSDIINGGTLELVMGKAPNKNWGTEK